jgi:uncharacterized protein YcfJ
MNNRIGLIIVCAMGLLTTGLQAAETVIHVPVLSYTPVHSTVVRREPVDDCQVHRQWQPAPVSPTGAILGGIVGAAIGNSLGHHPSNQRVGALAGGMLGASVGHDMASSGSSGQYREQTVCGTSWREVTSQDIVGYDVRYRWEGQVWETRVPEPPGSTLRLRVNAQPW